MRMGRTMRVLVWLILFVLCWPLAIAVLVLYPVAYLLSIPFRILGFAVEGVLKFLRGLILLPARIVGGVR